MQILVAIVLIVITIIVLIQLLGGTQKADVAVTVKSRQTLEKYDAIAFFRENSEKLTEAENVIKEKARSDEGTYIIRVRYVSPAGRSSAVKDITVRQCDIDRFKNDPTLLMSKAEYNKFIRDQQKEALSQKQHEYYEQVNSIIDYANTNKDTLVVKGDQQQLDTLIGQLFDRTVNSIKRVKTLDSEEWTLIGDFMVRLKSEIERIVSANQQILAYYESPDFLKIKQTCGSLMSSQREFNEYINEKIQSISRLFGTRVVRNETIHDDEYNYIRPYKKTITPFTAEVSSTVFASAENNPMEYIAKYFYPRSEELV